MTDPTLFTNGTPPAPADRSCGAGRSDHRNPSTPPAPPGAAAVNSPRGRDSVSGQVVGLLDALVAGLRGLGGERLEERLGLVGRCEARLAGVKAETVAALARRDGEARAAEVLRNGLKQSRGGAKREVLFAGRLAGLPGTAGALGEGAITPQHARTIADAAAHTPVDEAALLAAAGREPADVFARTVRDHVNERSAGEDLDERRRRQRAQREVSFKQESDGMYKLFGRFDPVAGARIETALAAAAKQLWHAEDAKRRATPAQRFADAFEMLVTRKGTGKAQSTTLLVIADYDAVAGQLRDARLADGTPLAASELLRLALDADILPALFDTKGQPLWLGHKYRHASVAQRIALAARDRGCAGCGASNSFCQAHHVIYWENGGPTDIDNLCLLCGDCHHTQVHERGAQLVRGPDGKLHLEPPPNQPPTTARNTKTRNTKTRPIRPQDRHNQLPPSRQPTPPTLTAPTALATPPTPDRPGPPARAGMPGTSGGGHTGSRRAANQPLRR